MRTHGNTGLLGDVLDRRLLDRFLSRILACVVRARSKRRGVEGEIEKLGEYGSVERRETMVVREATARSMRANRGKDTKPELAFRRALWAAGLRGYRKNVRKLPGSPDVVFGRARLAIFVHGCYWHQCPRCTRNRTPKTNAEYWQAKFAANAERDARQSAALLETGWGVLVLWECELRDLEATMRRVREALTDRSTRAPSAPSGGS